ncbi:hypothetical protein BX661DRAFT_183831 [Kickxella alabastrina]|uniref:uncharacterized protein n=1 Tax=Kickxella alabastrina TaxID=61397 RepID=UPI00222057EF|nr:uncharacterized protein BX661DRAFT_183831 [Kickxella alabastrina]KAI7826349.1 hypothetical protein BX661DRAFT_183831 [Kickxella alabastrina]
MAFRATSYLRQSLKLRPPFELALRSSCLQLVLARWGLETAALMEARSGQEMPDNDRKARAVEAITTAMYESGLEDHATAAEKSMLEKPYRTWEFADYTYGDHWEAFGVLQWLLGRQHAIPPYFSNFDRARLFQTTGIQPIDPSTIEKFVDPFMSSQTHQSIDRKQLQHEVNVAEAWFWRARAQVLLGLRDEIARTDAQKTQTGEDSLLETVLRTKHIPHSLRKMANDIPKNIPLAAQRALAKGIISDVEGDDFAITVEMKGADNGSAKSMAVPYSNLDENHLDSIRKIAESRFLAFAWSLGKASEWDADKIGELVSINPINALWTPDEK